MPDTSHANYPDERVGPLEPLSKRMQARADAAFRACWGAELAANEARIARIRAEDAARMAARRATTSLTQHQPQEHQT